MLAREHLTSVHRPIAVGDQEQPRATGDHEVTGREYLDHLARIGVPTFNGPPCLATFEVTNALGYRHSVSNRVVDGVAANGFLFRIAEILENAEFSM
jgi:hypothetical protein